MWEHAFTLLPLLILHCNASNEEISSRELLLWDFNRCYMHLLMALRINALFFLSLSKLSSLNGFLWCNGFSIQFQNIFLPAFSPSQSCPPPAYIILLHVTSLFAPSKWTIEIYGNDFNKQFDVNLPLAFKSVSPTVFPGNWNKRHHPLFLRTQGSRQNFKTSRAQSQWHCYLLRH